MAAVAPLKEPGYAEWSIKLRLPDNMAEVAPLKEPGYAEWTGPLVKITW